MPAATEAFPLLSTKDVLAPLAPPTSIDRPRAHRRSSGLGGEIRAGDTGAPAFATVDVRPPSPGTVKVCTLHPPPPIGTADTDVAFGLQAQNEKDRKKPFSKRRKAKTLLQQYKRYALKHTWVTPLILIGVFLSLYAINPTESNPIHHFIFLSYKIPLEEGAPPGTPPQYGKGPWDFALVSFYVIVLSFTREFIMQRYLRPLARQSGLKSRAKQSRFMEQMYTAIYFGILGPCGLWIMSQTPVWYFNTRGMYENFPHKTHEASFKFYYLFQAAYWAQQAIVLCLGMEKPRKDYKELVGHHIVSLALIGLSYRFHFTYMGLAVYITHDISDFFLAVCPYPFNFLHSKLTNLDLQNPQLPRPPAHRSLLRLLHRRMDLPPPLPQHQDSLVRIQRIQNRRPLRTQLGNRTIQMLDFALHLHGPASQSPGLEPLLALLYSAYCT
ncbi:sphingosine N-acyltransferase lag1 [Clarireedia jacksonii]